MKLFTQILKVLKLLEMGHKLNREAAREAAARDEPYEHILRAKDAWGQDAWYKLPPLMKLEIFMDVRARSRGDDLARMLWLTSRTSEAWLERRAAFSRSLAATR